MGKDIDYVTLLAVLGLTASACFALYFGESTIAGTAVGALAGVVYRLYR